MSGRDGLEAAVDAVLDALERPGPRPAVHDAALKNLRTGWPTLYNALGDLVRQRARRYTPPPLCGYHAEYFTWSPEQEEALESRNYPCRLTAGHDGPHCVTGPDGLNHVHPNDWSNR